MEGFNSVTRNTDGIDQEVKQVKNEELKKKMISSALIPWRKYDKCLREDCCFHLVLKLIAVTLELDKQQLLLLPVSPVQLLHLLLQVQSILGPLLFQGCSQLQNQRARLRVRVRNQDQRV